MSSESRPPDYLVCKPGNEVGRQVGDRSAGVAFVNRHVWLVNMCPPALSSSPLRGGGGCCSHTLLYRRTAVKGNRDWNTNKDERQKVAVAGRCLQRFYVTIWNSRAWGLAHPNGDPLDLQLVGVCDEYCSYTCPYRREHVHTRTYTVAFSFSLSLTHIHKSSINNDV